MSLRVNDKFSLNSPLLPPIDSVRVPWTRLVVKQSESKNLLTRNLYLNYWQGQVIRIYLSVRASLKIRHWLQTSIVCKRHKWVNIKRRTQYAASCLVLRLWHPGFVKSNAAQPSIICSPLTISPCGNLNRSLPYYLRRFWPLYMKENNRANFLIFAFFVASHTIGIS